MDVRFTTARFASRLSPDTRNAHANDFINGHEHMRETWLEPLARLWKICPIAGKDL